MLAITNNASCANATSKHSRICFKCSFNGQDKRFAWCLGDPWRVWETDANTWTHPRLFGCQPSYLYYEPHHMSNRFTNNTLSYLCETAEENGWNDLFTAVWHNVRRVQRDWEPHDDFQFKQNKLFFRLQIPQDIVTQFSISGEASIPLVIHQDSTGLNVRHCTLLDVVTDLMAIVGFCFNWTQDLLAAPLLFQEHQQFRSKQRNPNQAKHTTKCYSSTLIRCPTQNCDYRCHVQVPYCSQVRQNG